MVRGRGSSRGVNWEAEESRMNLQGDQILSIRRGGGVAFLRWQGEIQLAIAHAMTLAQQNLMLAPEAANK